MRTAYILAAYRTPSVTANKGHLKDVKGPTIWQRLAERAVGENGDRPDAG